MILASIVLILAGIYLSFYMAYWGLVLFTHFFLPARPPAASGPLARFVILIPAHNEELLLPRLLVSTRNLDYPNELVEIIVVADNCSDGTAEIARSEGATVIERMDEVNRGKGYAIKRALETIDLTKLDAVLIVDADCIIGADALRKLSGAIRVKQAIQCYNGVANPDDSWFTRLLDVSRAISNEIYHPAKQRLGLSSELTGTGMCFATEMLAKYGWDAFTIGEDWEYYAKLIEKGETVGFERNAKVYHQESTSLGQATSQRVRWSSGRFGVAWNYGRRLLVGGVIERSVIKFDAGLSLILPNPSLGMNLTLIFLVGGLLTTGSRGNAFVVWFFLLALAQLGVFILGVFYTKNKVSKFLAIFIAPAFLGWKMGIDALSILGIGRRRWVRTERKL